MQGHRRVTYLSKLQNPQKFSRTTAQAVSGFKWPAMATFISHSMELLSALPRRQQGAADGQEKTNTIKCALRNMCWKCKEWIYDANKTESRGRLQQGCLRASGAHTPVGDGDIT